MQECVLADLYGSSRESRRDPASRDPVGIQSGSSRAPMSGGSQRQKQKKKLQCFFARFFGDFGYFPTGPNVVPKIRKLVPDWIPTGFPTGAQMQKIGARLGPDWVPTGSRLDPDWVFFKKTSIALNLNTYF